VRELLVTQGARSEWGERGGSGWWWCEGVRERGRRRGTTQVWLQHQPSSEL